MYRPRTTYTKYYHMWQSMLRTHEDTGGAATVCASALAIAPPQVPYTRAPFSGSPPVHGCAISINLVVLTPLTGSMSHPAANHPGDLSVAYMASALDIRLTSCMR